MTKVILTIHKTTAQKVVFGEDVPQDSFEVPTIGSLYIDKRDLSRLGINAENPRLEVTLKAVPVS